MTKDELVRFVQNEITFSGAIDIKLPDNEVERIITNETRQIYDMDRESVQEKFAIIPLALFKTPEFRKTRTIQFPNCIRFITRVEEMKARSMMWGIHDPDISFTRAFQADLWMSPMGSDTVAFRTIQWSAWDQMKNFNLVDIQHKWNPNTHTLLFTGHDPHTNVYIEFSEKVPETVLWENPWVRKWICAKCKKQVSKMLGVFTANMVGGTTVNANVYSDDADNDMQECKDFWDKTNVPDYFICFP